MGAAMDLEDQGITLARLIVEWIGEDTLDVPTVVSLPDEKLRPGKIEVLHSVRGTQDVLDVGSVDVRQEDLSLSAEGAAREQEFSTVIGELDPSVNIIVIRENQLGFSACGTDPVEL